MEPKEFIQSLDQMAFESAGKKGTRGKLWGKFGSTLKNLRKPKTVARAGGKLMIKGGTKLIPVAGDVVGMVLVKGYEGAWDKIDRKVTERQAGRATTLREQAKHNLKVLSKNDALIQLDESRKKTDSYTKGYNDCRVNGIGSEQDCVEILYKLHCVRRSYLKLAMRAQKLIEVGEAIKAMVGEMDDGWSGEHETLTAELEEFACTTLQHGKGSVDKYEDALERISLTNDTD